MTAAAEQARLGSGPLAPAEVEAELGRLWRAEQEAEHAPEAAPAIAHARLVTLLVHAPDPAAAEVARGLARALNVRHPGRSIIMERRSGDADVLEAWAALRCAAAESGRRHACGELITLVAQGAGVERLPGAALSLLLPHLPVVLWWQAGSPMDDPVYEDLRMAPDRLLVDSLTFDPPADALGALVREMDEDPVPVPISDLSWARLAPWRYQVARSFDDPAAHQHLAALSTIHVRYAAGSPALAWLFGGWLASRLGWQPTGGDARAWRFAHGQVARFEPVTGSAVPEGLLPGGFLGVTLEAGAERFELARHGQACVCRRQGTGPQAADWQMEQVASLRADQPLTWLGHELGRAGRTRVYEAALRLVVSAITA